MQGPTPTELVGLAFLCSAQLAFQPAMGQEMARAYLLIETDEQSQLPEALGLMNCKGLTKQWRSSEVVAHIECNDLDSLADAVSSQIPRIEGVTGIITMAIRQH